jgi:hypothetical protein
LHTITDVTHITCNCIYYIQLYHIIYITCFITLYMITYLENLPAAIAKDYVHDFMKTFAYDDQAHARPHPPAPRVPGRAHGEPTRQRPSRPRQYAPGPLLLPLQRYHSSCYNSKDATSESERICLQFIVHQQYAARWKILDSDLFHAIWKKDLTLRSWKE